ncbi:hypothetical protein KIH77_02595 [Bifidobacterium sp. 82T24]|uniref:hypothetical protein n=1 Tax=Bifidobacterium pluvialisilvae TaxID=2834436 RepID=UPI001C589DFA|nr:hypothetical protein [Bifidobacterium pluvialisilvae]MBW3087631.1 hypothetical protein [Bifidobacterium pluvialisilvae]
MAKKARNISRRQQQIYRRRRIVAAILLVAVLAVFGGLIYGAVSGIRHLAGSTSSASASSSQTASGTVSPSDGKTDTKTTAGVPDCGGSDVTLTLTSDVTTVGVGGTVNFKATILHGGKTDCLINAANDSRVLTITSGNETIWRSDSCPADSRQLLMTGSDKDIQSVVWNTNRTGKKCAEDGSLPHVDAGTYVAMLSLKDNAAVKSDPLTITVQ